MKCMILHMAFKVGDSVRFRGQVNTEMMTVVEVHHQGDYICKWESGGTYPFPHYALELVDSPEG